MNAQTENGKEAMGAIVQLMIEQRADRTDAFRARYALEWDLEDSEDGTIDQSYDERIESYCWRLQNAEGWSDEETANAVNDAYCATLYP